MSAAAGFFFHHPPGAEEEVTSLLIVNAILSVGVLLVTVGGLTWAIQADRGPRAARKLRVPASARILGPAASLSLMSAVEAAA